MASQFRLMALFLTLLLTVTGCGGGGSGGGNDLPPQLGTLKLTIVDGDSGDPLTGIAEASILLLNGTGDPVKNYTSDIDGMIIQEKLTTGSYQLKVSAQGFNSSPAPKIPPLPVQILDNYRTTDITIKLYPHADAGTLGTITGSVTDVDGSGITGTLVIAKTGGISVATTISDADGNYILHNVPESTPELTAFIKGFNFLPIISEPVTVDGTTADQNIVAVSFATGVISGNLNFVAGAKVVPTDVTLLDPETREVIPGLRVLIDDNNNYTMNDIPDGDFEIIASLENDDIVLDPDLSSTQGIPLVTINGDVHTRDFKVTGAVELDTPETPTNNKVSVLSNTPTFAWHRTSSYSSADDYAIEVVDESGITLWGGFDAGTGQPLVTVPNNGTDSTVVYNSDDNASLPVLEADRYYQLRIYAINYVAIDETYPEGIQTLSSTENLDGVFKVEELP